MSDFTKTLRATGFYRLREGSLVQVTGSRDALRLDGKSRELVWVGKFVKGGGQCSWNSNGTYRASHPRNQHEYDIVEEIDSGLLTR